MKRTLKLTLSKIKNPGSLGANPKRDLPSRNAYPTLPTTKEETGGSGAERTESWVNSDNVDKPSAPVRDNEEDPSAKPPNYDQSVWQQYRAAQHGSQVQFYPYINQEMHQPMMPMNTAWHLPGTNNFQMNLPGTGHITSKRELVEEQKESMRQTLEKRNIPWDLWEYYIEIPED